MMAIEINDEFLIPMARGNAVSRGWTTATGNQPMGVTWHWTATRTLDVVRQVLGGPDPKRKGEASAHYGIGRSLTEGVDRYVSLENRSWHAGLNQTFLWNGRLLANQRFKASRTTIGVETVNVGYERPGIQAKTTWIGCTSPNGQQQMRVQPWSAEQMNMMIEVGKEIIDRWPHIRPRDHHGHHDICPGYKVDVCGFPFARVLRGIYDDDTIPDVWSPLWRVKQRQKVLIALGYDLGHWGVDGQWGSVSNAALKAFQEDCGITGNGMWTSFTNWQVWESCRGKGIDLADVTRGV
jgi:N-acetyl-anhydromuramyl-L-alanine amidase AmpD